MTTVELQPATAETFKPHAKTTTTIRIYTRRGKDRDIELHDLRNVLNEITSDGMLPFEQIVSSRTGEVRSVYSLYASNLNNPELADKYSHIPANLRPTLYTMTSGACQSAITLATYINANVTEGHAQQLGAPCMDNFLDVPPNPKDPQPNFVYRIILYQNKTREGKPWIKAELMPMQIALKVSDAIVQAAQEADEAMAEQHTAEQAEIEADSIVNTEKSESFFLD